MAQPASQAKVLRIGIIKGRNLVQERLIDQGEDVTIGESANNTFVFPLPKLPSPDYPLFVYGRDGYSLNFTRDMRGKISSGGAVVGLDKLRDDPSVQGKDGAWQLRLTERDRGKIGVDDQVTVLFQFVPPPPPQAVKSIQAMDFRPRWFDDDDPAVLGFLAFFTALAGVLLIYVWNTEVPETRGLEDLPDRFTQLVYKPKPVEDEPEVKEEREEPEELEIDGGTPQRSKVAKADTPEEGPAPKGQEAKVAEAKAQKAAEDQALASSLLLKKLVTRGENRNGTTAPDLWSEEDGGIDDLDSAVKGVQGVRIATDASEEGVRTGSGTSTEDVDIGALAGVSGGKSDGVGGGPAVKVSGSVDIAQGLDPEYATGDMAGVKAVVDRNKGQLTYCYESQLKADPSLSGRVEVEFTIARGRVTSAYVLANTTRNAELGSCIVGKVERWRGFPLEMAETVVYPFVFTPSG